MQKLFWRHLNTKIMRNGGDENFVVSNLRQNLLQTDFLYNIKS